MGWHKSGHYFIIFLFKRKNFQAQKGGGEMKEILIILNVTS